MPLSPVSPPPARLRFCGGHPIFSWLPGEAEIYRVQWIVAPVMHLCHPPPRVNYAISNLIRGIILSCSFGHPFEGCVPSFAGVCELRLAFGGEFWIVPPML